MLFPPKRTTIIVAATLLLSSAGNLFGQNAEYQRRLAAMQQARGRAATGYEEFNTQSNYRVAANPSGQEQVPLRVASRPTQATGNSSRSVPRNNVAPSNRVARMPQSSQRSAPNRVAQLHDIPMDDGGAPVMDHGVYENVIDDGGYYDESVGCDDCGVECGSDCGFFQGDHCCSDGSCPPGDCWLNGLGGVLMRGDYFFGAQGFRSPMYSIPGNVTDLEQDNNFGFYGGGNWGLPLCRLSCGLFAGQFGVRSVQSNFGGNEFTTENRDQLFMTAGLFRRVDYGFQGGVVADILWDNWYTETKLVQMRSDIGYLWVGGTSFGFRYHTNLSDDQTSGVIRGQTINNILSITEDSYRFYLRHEANSGGYGELFAGWTDSDQTILGGEIDVPITHMLATQAGVTYYMDDTVPPTASNRLGGYVNEAWNIYAGFSIRPCGRSYYRNYDRPFFNVADNGSMTVRRQ